MAEYRITDADSEVLDEGRFATFHEAAEWAVAGRLLREWRLEELTGSTWERRLLAQPPTAG